MERRNSDRKIRNDETSIFTKDGYFTAILTNISAGGLFLRTNKHIEIGEMIEITIPLSDGPDHKNVKVNVIAVRVMDDGVAFKFQTIDNDAQSALLHLQNSAYT